MEKLYFIKCAIIYRAPVNFYVYVYSYQYIAKIYLFRFQFFLGDVPSVTRALPELSTSNWCATHNMGTSLVLKRGPEIKLFIETKDKSHGKCHQFQRSNLAGKSRTTAFLRRWIHANRAVLQSPSGADQFSANVRF